MIEVWRLSTLERGDPPNNNSNSNNYVQLRLSKQSPTPFQLFLADGTQERCAPNRLVLNDCHHFDFAFL
jgi:hypothetical protein